METTSNAKINRLSVVVAIILTAFGVSVLVPARIFDLNISVLKVLISFPIDLNFLSNLLTGLLAATGMVWFLQLHPGITGNNTLLQHALLPSVTAYILNISLHAITISVSWWVIFFIGGMILFLIILAEYTVIDPLDIWYPVASAGLLSLTYALFLILLSVIAFSGARLFVLIVSVFPVASLLSFRALHLRTGIWASGWAVGIGFITTQFALVLHYWPLTPVQYGLFLTGVIFSLLEFAQNTIEGETGWRAFREPLFGLVIFLLIGLFAR